MKKGQMMSQPFVMLFAIIVGALIFVWGTYYIYKIVNLSEDVQLTDTMNKFQRIVDQYYHFNEGSSRDYNIILPSKFDKICFYSSDLGWSPSDSGLNRGFMESRRNDTIFVLPLKGDCVFSVRNIRPEGKNPLCFKSGEEFVITSRDDHVGVSR